MKQAVVPRGDVDAVWAWLDERVAPEVAVLTEAKVPKTGPPAGWSAVFDVDGVGPRRRWGTVVAARGLTLDRVDEVKVGRRTVELRTSLPGCAMVADASRDGERWATIVGIYGLTVDDAGESCKHGRHSTRRILRELEPLLESDRGSRIILAGDLNLWPKDRPRALGEWALHDVLDHTAERRPPLAGCRGCDASTCPACGTPRTCGHVWTHRNGNSPNAARQQLDFVFCTDELLTELTDAYGGIEAFPDAWDISDHAPVVGEFWR